MQETELKIKIKVDDTELDKVLAKAKELQNILGKCNAALRNNYE